jgi:hypothetical protein
VQIRRVKRELHRISNVPRTLVDETKFTTSGGRVQLGENVLEAAAVWRRRSGSSKDHMLLSHLGMAGHKNARCGACK